MVSAVEKTDARRLHRRRRPLSHAPVDGTLSNAFSHASSASASLRTTGSTKGDAMIRPVSV